MVNVSIIIVNYNSSKLIIDCIKSIHRHTQNISYEIIIVDNASKQEELCILHDYICDYEDIIFLNNKTNLGFGNANNLGAQHATGEFLFFLNPDTILLNNAILILYETLLTNSSIGICGGQLYDVDGYMMHSYSMFLPGIRRDWDTAFNGLFSKCKKRNRHTLFQVGYITGADLMITKSLFNKVGGFDKDFFMYYEESEMTYRIKKMGYNVVCNPNAEIIHLDTVIISKY